MFILINNLDSKYLTIETEFAKDTTIHVVYLYKKIICFHLQRGVNFLHTTIKQSLIIILSTMLMTGCYTKNPSEIAQQSALHLTQVPHKKFKQLSGDAYRPSSYFACNQIGNPCPYITGIGKQISHPKTKQQKSIHFNFKGDNRE